MEIKAAITEEQKAIEPPAEVTELPEQQPEEVTEEKVEEEK